VAGRLIPLASSAIGGALIFRLCEAGAPRPAPSHRKHLEVKAAAPPPSSAYGSVALQLTSNRCLCTYCAALDPCPPHAAIPFMR